MEKIVALLAGFWISMQTFPGALVNRVQLAITKTPPAASAEPTQTPPSSPESVASPTPAPTPTPTPTSTPAAQGTIRVYARWGGDGEYPAMVQGECDYNNPNRKIPPCRGGLNGFTFPIYNSKTGVVVQSAKTDASGWITVSLPPGSYYVYRSYRGGQPYLPEAHKTPFEIVAGKQSAYLHIEVEP